MYHGHGMDIRVLKMDKTGDVRMKLQRAVPAVEIAFSVVVNKNFFLSLFPGCTNLDEKGFFLILHIICFHLLRFFPFPGKAVFMKNLKFAGIVPVKCRAVHHIPGRFFPFYPRGIGVDKGILLQKCSDLKAFQIIFFLGMFRLNLKCPGSV